MSSLSLSQAEELRRKKKHAAALPVFEEAWNARHHPDVGWRYANCLRNVGRAAEALAVCEQLLEDDPENLQVRREATWAVYAASFRPAAVAGNYREALAAAQRMEALGADGFALKRLVLGVARLAKANGDWNTVVQWTDKVAPRELDPNPRSDGDRVYLPERLLWYFARVRALLELGLYAEVLDAVEQAEKDYPGQKDLLRWKAMALARRGDLEEALEIIRAVSAREKDSYIHDTLAEIAEQAGDEALAFSATCRSLAAPGKLPTKIRAIERLARLALDRGDARTAVLNVRLALAIREREGWKIRFELEDLAGRAEASLAEPVPEQPFRALLEECRKTWETAAEAPDGEGDGTVAVVPDGKPFAFVRLEDGRDVFTPLEILPPQLRQRGTRVHVRWKLAWDRKRQRDSLRAIGITPAAPRSREERHREPPGDDFRLDT